LEEGKRERAKQMGPPFYSSMHKLFLGPLVLIFPPLITFTICTKLIIFAPRQLLPVPYKCTQFQYEKTKMPLNKMEYIYPK